ncbi:hypothetical protein KSS87_014167 [Heliosperma pusillum]|nr:hypothetical protein KSS87_014167 [Heliosperma pusillum]
MVMVEDEIDMTQSIFYAINFFDEAIMEINEVFLNQFVIKVLNIYFKFYSGNNGKDVAFNFSQAGKDLNDKLKSSHVSAAAVAAGARCRRPAASV